MIKFTNEQILWLEDTLINKLTPAYTEIDLIIMGRETTKERLRTAIKQLDNLVESIRNLRPESKRIRR